MKNQFNPTQLQIMAAENLFIAMALRDVIEKSFMVFENQLLLNGNFRSADGNSYIKDRKQVYKMEGIREVGSEKYANTDAHQYYEMLSQIAENAGFIHKENAFCVADHKVTQFQNALMEATQNIHQLTMENIYHTSMENRKQLIELLLKLFSSIVKPTEERKQEYYKEHLDHSKKESFIAS